MTGSLSRAGSRCCGPRIRSSQAIGDVMIEPEAPVRPAPLRLEPGAVGLGQRQRGAVVDRRHAPAEQDLALELQLLRRLIGRIDPARPRAAARAPLHSGRTGRTGGAPRPAVEAEPGEIVADRRRQIPRSLRSRSVSSMPQEEAPALLARPQPIVQRRADIADMEPAGRRGGEAGDDCHRRGSRAAIARGATLPSRPCLRARCASLQRSRAMKLMAGNSNLPLAQAIAHYLETADHRGERAPLRRRGGFRRDPRECPRRGRVRGPVDLLSRPTTI